MAMKKCAKCGGAMAKMSKGGYAPTLGGDNTKMGIYGIPNAGRTDQLGFKSGGSVKPKAKVGGSLPVCKGGKVRSATGDCVMERPKFKSGGSAFGMLSVKAGIDKNPKPTAADRIAGAKKNLRKKK